MAGEENDRASGGKGEKYAGKTEEEWRDWGEDFGKKMDRLGRHFGDEMDDWGERFSDYMERKSKRWERKWERRQRRWGLRWKNWWFETLGPVGPLLGSVLSMAFLLLAVVVLDLVNGPAKSHFISAVTAFIMANIYLFFAVSLVMNYGRYFTWLAPATRWIIRPITGSVAFVFALFILVFVFSLVDSYAPNSFIESLSGFISQNLIGIFVVILVLGYVFELVFKLFFDLWED